ncbi:hypothetical protein [Pontiella sp.]|uniref:hypothetical protein n=1 Tax=Pontiella sp. TaxID=2837462 RepID=UPI0035617DE1
MSIEPKSILGGESVYCINEAQLKESQRLVNEDPVSAPKLQEILESVESCCSRNERAALAFTLIERLRQSTEK